MPRTIGTMPLFIQCGTCESTLQRIQASSLNFFLTFRNSEEKRAEVSVL